MPGMLGSRSNGVVAVELRIAVTTAVEVPLAVQNALSMVERPQFSCTQAMV
jgi:hypothetical protein